MSRVYVLTVNTDSLITSPPQGLTVFHRPFERHPVTKMPTDKPSLWPYALTDGTNYGWLENNQILFWGTGNDEAILSCLERAGIYIIDMY